MELLTRIFSDDFYIYWVEVLTIVAVIIVLAYFFYSLNLFKRG